MAELKEAAKEGEPAILEGSAFESLERDFQQVLQELVGDKSLERFRTEYEKLHRALKKSHESEKRLVKKARELNAEIVQNAQKVQTALKLSQEDQNTIASLKREIEKAWKMVDAAHDKEGRAKDTIGQLKTEIANLSRLVEQGAGLSIGQENTVNELMKVKNELMRERDHAMAQVHALRAEVGGYLAKVANLENDAASQQAQIAAFREQIASRKADAEREAERKEQLEAELRAVRDALDERQANLRSTLASIQNTNEALTRTEHLLRDERVRTDRAAKEADVLDGKNAKQATHDDELGYTATQLIKEGAERAVELRLREDEVSAHRKEIGRLNAQIDGLTKRASGIGRAQAQVDEERVALKRTLNELDARLVEARRARDVERKAKDAAGRERELLNKQLVKSRALTHQQADAVRLHEGVRKTLEQQIGAHKADAYRQRKAALQLEKEVDSLALELRDASAKHAQALDELRAREASVVSQQRRIGDVDNKLKQQHNLYEAVRADRNLYNKNLLEARDEIVEMRRKLKVMGQQIEQLKEEIHSRDHALVREHFEHMKVGKERDALKDEVVRVKKQTVQADEATSNYRAELSKLSAIIAEADSEGLRQAKESDVVLNERDLLGLQLIRRNEELGLLYEKIRIHESMLRKGEAQYDEATQAVAQLKTRLAQLRSHVDNLRASVVNVGTIRDEVYDLARKLMHERTKVKALESELGKPLNVHRWRKLEGSDPAAYEMLQKVQVLQKRLIGKAEEAVSKGAELSAKDRLYAELKAILARQPGPEIAEQLAVYRNALREKDQQTEQMASELAMYHAQVGEYKTEIDRVVRELHEVKVKFYDQKRKEQLHRERVRLERTKPLDAAVAEARASLPRFTGGGFSLQRH